MLHATELLGSETYDAQGNFVGRVKEFYLEPAEQGNRISRILLTRGKFQPLLARHDQIGFIAPGTIRLTVGEKELEPYQPNESWLAVRKDLLDQQIIDTHGRKVVRVNDLDMTEQRMNGNVELRIARVDVGLTGAVGRLLQGLASPAMIRKIQEKLPPRMIPWEFVNLIEPDPLRRVKLRLTSSKLAHMHPADLAELMEELSPDERSSVIATLDEESAAEVIAELDKRVKTQVLETLDTETAAGILEEMPPDDAADLLADLPIVTSRELLRVMPQRVAEGEAATRGEVVDYIRFHDVPLDQLDTVILINTHAVFVGTVSVTRLMLAEKDQRMAALVNDPLVSIEPRADEKEVFELFDKYNLRSLTVVNSEKQPIGAITVDDIVSRMHAKLR